MLLQERNISLLKDLPSSLATTTCKHSAPPELTIGRLITQSHQTLQSLVDSDRRLPIQFVFDARQIRNVIQRYRHGQLSTFINNRSALNHPCDFIDNISQRNCIRRPASEIIEPVRYR